MPRGSEAAPLRTETPADLRAMGLRARRLAANTLDDRASASLLAYAEELEARAAALEKAPKTISHEEAGAAQRSDPDIGQS